MGEDRRTRLLGCRDGLAHALNSISSLRRSITGPSGEYLPPKRHTRKRAAAEARIAELDKARDAIRRQLKGVQDALATPTAPLQENTMTDLSLREQIANLRLIDMRPVPGGYRLGGATADAILELLKGAVKPLEWHTREDGSMSCRGAYEITHSEGRYFPWTLTCASYPHPMYLSSGDSSEALVKVAEDHNRSRILAALGVK